MAVGRAGYQRQPLVEFAFGGRAEHPQCACMGVDHRDRDRDARFQAPVARGGLGQVASPATNRQGLCRKPKFLFQFGQPDRAEEVLLPAGVFMVEIGPLAGDSTGRRSDIVSGFPDQEIGQVHRHPITRPRLWQVALEP